MGYILNSDLWHVVNPEDQKVHRLVKGDEVPDWALPEGDELKAVTEDARVPLFVRDEEKPSPRNQEAVARDEREQAPQQPGSKDRDRGVK